MTEFSNQLYVLIDSDIGVVVYQLVLTFSIVGALFATLSAWGNLERSQSRRLLIALGLLLVLRLGYLVVSFLVGQNIILGGELLPVIDRGVSLLSLLAIIWIWVFPAPNRVADASTVILGLLLITITVFCAVWWVGESRLAGFNHSLGDRILDYTALSLIAVGVILLLVYRPGSKVIAGIMFLVLATGYLVDLLYPPPLGDYSAAVRISQIIAFPLLLFLPIRSRLGERSLTGDSGESTPVRLDLVSEDFPISALDGNPLLNDLFNLLSASSYDQVCKLATRFVAAFMQADVCLWIHATSDHYQVHCAYDQVAGAHLPALILYPQQFPIIVAALDESRSVRLPTRTVSPDITNLARFYDFKRVGHVLVVPASLLGENSLSALALLSTFSDHPWSHQEGQELSHICHHLAQFLHHNVQVSGGRVDLIQTRQKIAELEAAHQRLQLENRKLQELIDLIAQHVEQGRTSLDQSLGTGASHPLPGVTDLQSELADIEELIALARQLPSVEESDLYNEELRQSKQKLALLSVALAESEAAIVKLKSQAGDTPFVDSSDPQSLKLAYNLRLSTSTIIEYARLLLAESFAELEPIQRKFLRQIVENATAQARLLEEWIIHFSRSAQGSGPLPQPVEIESVIKRALLLSEPQFREKDIKLTTDFPRDLPPLYIDGDILRVILTNIFQKLGAVLPVSAPARIEVCQPTPGTGEDYLLLRVLGGEPDSEQRLPDFLVEPIPDGDEYLQGLPPPDDLAVVRDLVSELGGNFEIIGELGYGGVIRLYLPLRQSQSVDSVERPE